MSDKSAGLAFKPAPRPQPRVSPEQTRELAEATKDLGFGRTTSPPTAPADPAPSEANPAPRPEFSPAPRPTHSTPVANRAAEPPRRAPALKFDVPDAVWNALRHEALNRRVTVKYLVLEALAEKGYAVDLSAVPEDGRRLR